MSEVKRPASLIATVIWKPFDARFNEFLTRMDNHRKFIMDELEIIQTQQVNDAERAAARERTRAEKEREKAAEGREKARKLASETKEVKKTLEKEVRGR